ncbi:MAG: DMT family transporter [Bacteroidales bacterium]|nr:DMT family transporter [Bacteroidales bacterium]
MKGIDRQTFPGHLSMFFANVIWGIMAPVSKYVMSQESVSCFAVTGYRILGACVLFWIASLFVKKEKVPRRDKIRLIFASLLAVVFNQGSYVCGVSLTSPVDASVIVTVLPIITMILSAIILKEPITSLKVIGIALGLSGAIILIWDTGTVGGDSNIWGDLLCLSAQFSFAFYTVLFKDIVGKYSPVTMMKWMFLWASVFTMPFFSHDMLAMDYANLDSSVYWGLVHVVVGGTFIGYFLIPIGQHRLRPTVFVMYNYVQPVVSTAVSVAVGMSVFGWWKAAATILIFAGVFVVTQSKSRAEMEGKNGK